MILEKPCPKSNSKLITNHILKLGVFGLSTVYTNKKTTKRKWDKYIDVAVGKNDMEYGKKSNPKYMIGNSLNL